jgi:hypothetical protein
MKKYYLIGATVALLAGTTGLTIGWVMSKPKTTVTTHSPGTVPAGNIAPSEKFLADYANYKVLKQKVDDANIDLQGAIGRLNAEVPQGFLLDEKSMQFIPRPVQAPVSLPAKP